MALLYFDHGAVSPPSPRIISSMMPYFTDRWASPHQLHTAGQLLVERMQDAVDIIEQGCGISGDSRFVFTSSGVEALNQLFYGWYRSTTLPTGRNHYLSAVNCPMSQVLSSLALEELGALHTVLSVGREGFVTAEQVADHLSPRSVALSLSWVDPATGVVIPREELEQILILCKERGLFVHLEMTAALPALSAAELPEGVNFLSFDGAALHAPLGTGGLFISEGTNFPPLLYGGGEQGAMRAGEYSTAFLVALAAACKELKEARDYLCAEGARLSALFLKSLHGRCGELFIPLYLEEERVPHIIALKSVRVHAEALAYAAAHRGLYFSCPAADRIVLTLARTTTEREVEQAAEILADEALRYRELSMNLLGDSEPCSRGG